jgi:hypothetical protein
MFMKYGSLLITQYFIGKGSRLEKGVGDNVIVPDTDWLCLQDITFP